VVSEYEACFRTCTSLTYLLEQTRDVLFSLSGFTNARCIHDEEVDTTLITEKDWIQEVVTNPAAEQILPQITSIHKHFFVQNSKLAILG
jgi:hypothetical protein